MADTSTKIVEDPSQLSARLEDHSRPLVFTNGCFDILHCGHVAYLEEAAALGSTLLVALNSDDSVRAQGKPDGRPIVPLNERMRVLASLACVSLVTSFGQETPLDLIVSVKPDHLVKGGDWPLESIVGADIVQANGGNVHSIPFRYQQSTTNIVNRIRRLSSAAQSNER